MSLTDEQCAQIASWSRSFVSPPRIVVDRDRSPGDPLQDMQEPALYAHPEDYIALLRWADLQARFMP